MQIEAHILLAGGTQGDGGGGVSALGIGWQVRDPDPGIVWALVIVIEAPRSTIGSTLKARTALEKISDGSIVTDGESNECSISFDVKPDGLKDEGLLTPVVVPFGFNLPPLPLEPGQEYQFRLWVDEETRDHWVATFRTPPP